MEGSKLFLNSSICSASLAFAMFAMAAAQSALHSSGGLQLLTLNDLTQTLIPSTGAILLNTPRNSSSQAAVCASLGETLWKPEENDFSHSLNASLYYLEYTDQYTPSQVFHIAGDGEEDGWECRYLSTTGRVNYMDCKSKLPALCTNSAPLSDGFGGDRDEKWRFVQKVGGTDLMGWRDQHTFKFQGIKFTEPVDRYEYSVPKDMLRNEDEEMDVVDVTNYGAPCWQPVGEITEGMSEDCLHANVWTTYLPTGPEAEVEQKAVMVNIHGGGFITGSGANANYDGTNLASRGDVVVVNLNYRIGNLGNVAFTDGIHNGNYGLGDLISGLEWVRENIQYFGGDRDRVTIFGESAGASAVRALLSSEKAKGLFHNAIEQSGPQGWDIPGYWDWIVYRDPEFSAETVTTKIAEEVDCPTGADEETLQCLREIDPETLVNLATLARFQLLDDDILTVSSLSLSAEGTAADVNLITGRNRNEAGILIAFPEPDVTNVTEWAVGIMTAQLGNIETNAFLPLLDYLPADSSPATAYNITEHLVDLVTFICASHATTYSAALHGAVRNIWQYEFTRSYSPFGYTTDWCSAPATDEFPDGDPSQEYYKCHGGEQLFACGTMVRSGQPDRDGKDIILARLAVDYWTSLARTGDPNPSPEYLSARRYYGTKMVIEESGDWEKVTVENPGTMRLLQVPPVTNVFPEGDKCAHLGLPLEHWEEVQDEDEDEEEDDDC